jgi:hypothetical protein
MTDLFRLDRMVANHRSDFWNGSVWLCFWRQAGKSRKGGTLDGNGWE